MNQMQIPHKASPPLGHCEPSLPASAYYDPAWYAEERTRIWAASWVHAGRLDDLAPMTMPGAC